VHAVLTRTFAFPLKSLASHCSSFGKAVFDTQLQPQSHAKKRVYSRIENAQIYHRRNVCLFQLHARPGWYFLTGDKQNVDFALNKLGQFVSDKQDHLNIFIVGNERTGLWKKAFGLARSDEIVKVVESVLNDQPPRDK